MRKVKSISLSSLMLSRWVLYILIGMSSSLAFSAPTLRYMGPNRFRGVDFDLHQNLTGAYEYDPSPSEFQDLILSAFEGGAISQEEADTLKNEGVYVLWVDTNKLPPEKKVRSFVIAESERRRIREQQLEAARVEEEKKLLSSVSSDRPGRAASSSGSRSFGVFNTLIGGNSFRIASTDGARILDFADNWTSLMSAQSLDELHPREQFDIENFEISYEEIEELEFAAVQALFDEDWSAFRDHLRLSWSRLFRSHRSLKQFNLLARMKLQALSGLRYWGPDRIAAGSIPSVENRISYSDCQISRVEGLLQGVISPQEYFTMKQENKAPIPLKHPSRSPDRWLLEQTRCVRYEGPNRINGRIGRKHEEEARQGGPWGLGFAELYDTTNLECEIIREYAYEMGAITEEELYSLIRVNSYPILKITGKAADLRIPVDRWLMTWAPCGKVPRDTESNK